MGRPHSMPKGGGKLAMELIRLVAERIDYPSR